MAHDAPPFPWYKLIEDDEIEQGDLFPNCPCFLPALNLAFAGLSGSNGLPAEIEAGIELDYRDLVVLTQSCDMVAGQNGVEFVVLCAADTLDQLDPIGKDKLEVMRKGNNPKAHLLPSCDLAGATAGVRVVDFTAISTIPLAFLRERAKTSLGRPRLLHPYRESLSQAYGRFMMRVGLPDGMEISSFNKK